MAGLEIFLKQQPQIDEAELQAEFRANLRASIAAFKSHQRQSPYPEMCAKVIASLEVELQRGVVIHREKSFYLNDFAIITRASHCSRCLFSLGVSIRRLSSRTDRRSGLASLRIAGNGIRNW
jgi:hypothetical protein